MTCHTLNIRRKKFGQQRNARPLTRKPQISTATPTVNIVPLSKLILDERNANVGTARGRKMLEESIRTLGTGRSVLVDRRGRIIAGNKTIEMARKLGMKKIAVVQSQGDTLVAVQRADLDLKRDKKAKRLAVADNRISEVDLSWSTNALQSYGIDLTEFWNEKELKNFGLDVPKRRQRRNPNWITPRSCRGNGKRRPASFGRSGNTVCFAVIAHRLKMFGG